MWANNNAPLPKGKSSFLTFIAGGFAVVVTIEGHASVPKILAAGAPYSPRLVNTITESHKVSIYLATVKKNSSPATTSLFNNQI
jgi:hypothetical protein